MILHELATNAAKYGALSGEIGQVAISWRLDMDGSAPRVTLDWMESGGPPVEPPTRQGHGTSFVERSVAFELEGEASLEFRREGVRATIAFPLDLPSATPEREEPV